MELHSYLYLSFLVLYVCWALFNLYTLYTGSCKMYFYLTGLPIALSLLTLSAYNGLSAENVQSYILSRYLYYGSATGIALFILLLIGELSTGSLAKLRSLCITLFLTLLCVLYWELTVSPASYILYEIDTFVGKVTSIDAVMKPRWVHAGLFVLMNLLLLLGIKVAYKVIELDSVKGVWFFLWYALFWMMFWSNLFYEFNMVPISVSCVLMSIPLLLVQKYVSTYYCCKNKGEA
ncbi:MAG: hypothetical protein OCD01_04080 [Fibrobacterales bacterium]